MTSGELNYADTEENNTNQPIVENTRTTGGQPIYEEIQGDRQRSPAQTPSIYQPLNTKTPVEDKPENYYQPLSKNSKVSQESAHAG